MFIATYDPRSNTRGSLFVSDLNGADFILSLPRISLDFFLRFVLLLASFLECKKALPLMNLRLEQTDGLYLISRFNAQNIKQTAITYNKGAEWWPLNAPDSEDCVSTVWGN